MQLASFNIPGISLLYVEDDPCARETVRAVISEQIPGAVVHAAEDGETGLRMFKEHRPDIVLTDISMPVMNGIEMAFNIRTLDPAANIIALSARDETHYLQDAVKLGLSRYLLKPLDLSSLFEAIDDCMARIRTRRDSSAQQDLVRQLGRAVEQGPGMVMITNPRGVIQYVNPSFTRFTGYEAREVVGQNLLAMLANINSDADPDLLRSAMTRRLKWRGEFMSRKKNGELYFKEVSISPVVDEAGAVIQFVAVMDDITDRKQTGEKMRQLNEELNQRLKERTLALEASTLELDAFCYSVAHDLSTPLRGMNCFSSILLEEYGDRLDECAREYLRRIESASERMGQLINDLLNLSRVTRGTLNRTGVDLSSFAEEILERLAEKAPDRVVESSVAAGMEVNADRCLARLLLENLLGNAWKFTSKEPGARIVVGSYRQRGETVYYVRDNGIGFDMEHASRMFIPFERLHGIEEFEGTGTGLATVQRIVTKHGGRVWAEGEEGKGATVYFSFGCDRH